METLENCDMDNITRDETAGNADLFLGAALTISLSGCGEGGGDKSSAPPPTGSPQTPPTTDTLRADQAARFLLHASLSASKAEIDEIISVGFERWLDTAMDYANDLSAREFIENRGFDQIDANQHHGNEKLADYVMWNQLLSGGNGVRKRVALALSEFFVVNIDDLNIRWRHVAIASYWDMLNEHAFGNFRTLLEEVALHPTMASFLDTIGSQKADPATNRQPDENFARELMQLFTIGLVELGSDGQPKGGSAERETYSNRDVTELAKCFTGYDFDFSHTEVSTVPGGNWALEHPDFLYSRVTAHPSRWRRPRTDSLHSDEAKTFLGVTVPEGAGATESLRIALDTLFGHPNTGPFFARQMIQRLVTSNPSGGYVERVAKVFADNGRGQRGDLKAVFKAILLDPEARDDKVLSNQRCGKLREPMLRLAQWGRTFNASSVSGDWTIERTDRDYDQLGQSPFRAPSVFNFFRPSFVPAGSNAERNGMVAPEFQIADETSVAGYVNFLQSMIEDRSYSGRDVKVSFEKQIALAHDPVELLDHYDLVLTANQLSTSSRSLILEAIESVALSGSDDDEGKLRRARIGALLVMASPDYLVQR